MRRLLAIAATAALGAVAAASSASGAPTVLAELPAGADARDVARDNGVVLARAFPQIGWAEYALPPAEPAAARRRLLDDGRVVRLDFQRRGESLEPELVPNDPYTAQPLQFEDGVETDFHWEQGRFYSAWDLGRGSLGTRVAVIDSEIDTAHPDLSAKVVAAYNAERQFAATYGGADTRASDAQIAEAQASPSDNDLHGSHVAGTVAAATNNATGVSGAGFDAALMPVKITLTVPAGPAGDATFVANSIDGIVWATDNGADVINMSFGTSTPHPALAAAVAYAVSQDVLPVAAAGNTQGIPGALGIPLYPAAFDGVLAVGATDSNGVITSFSTNGSYVDAAAPGSRILSVWDTRAPGITVGGQPVGGYQVLTGTSMASSVVAGLAALVRDLRPDLPAFQVQDIILATAADRGAPGRDPQYGAGLIDAEAALRAATGATPASASASGPALPVTAPAPPVAAPLRRRARIVYRCSVGGTRVPTGAAAPLRVGRGRRLVCRGRTVPGLGGARLQVQRLAKGRWTRIGSFRTTASGRFGFVVPLRTAGRWTVRGALPATAALAPAAGPRARVAVFARG